MKAGDGHPYDEEASTSAKRELRKATASSSIALKESSTHIEVHEIMPERCSGLPYSEQSVEEQLKEVEKELNSRSENRDFVKQLNSLSEERQWLLYCWDVVDLLILVVWTGFYGPHVKPLDQPSFYLICGFTIMAGAILLCCGYRGFGGYYAGRAEFREMAHAYNSRDGGVVEGWLKVDEQMNGGMKSINRHVYRELIYDILQIFVVTFLFNHMELQEKDWPFKLFIDFLNVATTVLDLLVLKGAAGLKALADPSAAVQMLLHEAEEFGRAEPEE